MIEPERAAQSAALSFWLGPVRDVGKPEKGIDPKPALDG